MHIPLEGPTQFGQPTLTTPPDPPDPPWVMTFPTQGLSFLTRGTKET